MQFFTLLILIRFLGDQIKVIGAVFMIRLEVCIALSSKSGKKYELIYHKTEMYLSHLCQTYKFQFYKETDPRKPVEKGFYRISYCLVVPDQLRFGAGNDATLISFPMF